MTNFKKLLGFPFWAFPRGSWQYDVAVFLVVALLIVLPILFPCFRDPRMTSRSASAPAAMLDARDAPRPIPIGNGSYFVPARPGGPETETAFRSALDQKDQERLRAVPVRDGEKLVGMLFVPESGGGTP